MDQPRAMPNNADETAAIVHMSGQEQTMATEAFEEWTT